MSNARMKRAMFLAFAAMFGLLFAGCQSTANITITIRTPGEYNLSGISKLAIVDFNSMDSQPGQGIFEADAETLSVVQGKVCAAFAKNKTYAIARLDAEKLLQDDYKGGRVSPRSRFDGIVYGRVWWQVSPELCGTYPKVFNLRQWVNIPYEVEVLGKKIENVARVTSRTSNTLEMLPFRAWNASLMLSLSIYKLDSKGDIEKLTETCAMATQKYLMNNGVFSEQQDVSEVFRTSRGDNVSRSSKEKSLMKSMGDSVGDFMSGKKEKTGADGVFKASNVTVSLPTELQAKFTLADKLTAELARKLMPNDTTIEIENDFSDTKIFFLVRDGAFNSGVEYSRDILEKKLKTLKNRKIVEREMQELDNVGESSDVPYDVNLSQIAISQDTRKYIKDNMEYFYAKALCNEACGNTQEALRGYRFAFHFVPSRESANGISRCLFALEMAHDVKKVNKDVRRSTKKARLD